MAHSSQLYRTDKGFETDVETIRPRFRYPTLAGLSHLSAANPCYGLCGGRIPVYKNRDTRSLEDD